MSFARTCLPGAICASIVALSPLPAAFSQTRLLGADNASGQLHEIDPQSAASTIIGPFSHPFVASLTWDSTNHVLYATTSDTTISLLLRVNPDTGATTSVGPLGTFFMHGIEYNPLDDTLYGVASGGGGGQRLYRINRATGAATLVAPINVTGIIDIAFDPVAGVMYLAEIAGQRLRTLNLTNGSTTIIGPFNAPGMPFSLVGVGMAFDSDLGLHATDNTGIPGNPNPLYGINTNSGQATLIGFTSGTNMLGLAFVPDCPADLNADGAVGLQDLTILLAHFGQTEGAQPQDGDLDGDGDVDLADLTSLLARFGMAC